MADMKEKLVELLFNVPGYVISTEELADHLIANGVTLDNQVSSSKWISVKDRLPEYEEPVMGWDAEMRDMGIVNFIYGKFFDILDMSETNVTHWMPLPEPPKGE